MLLRHQPQGPQSMSNKIDADVKRHGSTIFLRDEIV